jgi:hypothetical protein
VHLKWQKAGKLTVINAVDRTVISKYMRKRLLGCKWKNQEKKPVYSTYQQKRIPC